MCMFCKSGTVGDSTTTHAVDIKDSIIIIRNVPCLECDLCGETYYTGVVVEKLERLVDEAKSLNLELSVTDYLSVT